ncbi:hypothetical protein ATANTOWER_015810 [Ataeniobius toweri]|uniref:Uncharacterized protein n=1 Tax=Ataeniobius toweri TaxID=208326 RepID=A0ABU7A789_9TELE|nr:hypothetical protein [Ataeniobius toweri]
MLHKVAEAYGWRGRIAATYSVSGSDERGSPRIPLKLPPGGKQILDDKDLIPASFTGVKSTLSLPLLLLQLLLPYRSAYYHRFLLFHFSSFIKMPKRGRKVSVILTGTD